MGVGGVSSRGRKEGGPKGAEKRGRGTERELVRAKKRKKGQDIEEGIEKGGRVLKSGSKEMKEESCRRGRGKRWSMQGFYHHLRENRQTTAAVKE